ncbi:MAG: hypothetical protein J7K96_00200 [Desulfobacteraceae bacterium]|nr:hypothetical protein [Desulfobacteraceae bacterium]
MKCDKCKKTILENEERVLYGQTLCEDCYMDRLSPAKACDPWAVFTAKSFSKGDGADLEMTGTQSRIIEILKETGGAKPEEILEALQITPADLDREIATLRHMEKVRGELQGGKKKILLW